MTVLLATLEKRVNNILLASPRTNPWSASVVGLNGQPATARYPTDEEIEQACLEGDARTCVAIIETEGHPQAPTFYTTSTVASGAAIPGHLGVTALVTIDDSPARYAANMDQMLEVVANPTMYPVATRWAYIFGNILLHNGTEAVVTYPAFTMTSACQAPDGYESVDVCNAVSLLAKDGAASDYYSYYSQLALQQEAAIRRRELIIPQIEAIAA